MAEHPAVVVHDLSHAPAALRAARDAGRTVTLLSAEGASAHVGPGWFAELIDAARAEVPDAAFDAYLDCADRPGDVLAALRRGVPGVIFTGRADVADRLAALAEAHGTPFLRARPEALDLLDRPEPAAAVRAHLVRA
jgi:hypothetical protein